jgi:uncharacterized protein (UPF0303 family)
MDIATLESQETRLVLPRFTEDQALSLGLALIEAARGRLPIAIDIRTPDRTLFHISMQGATAINDRWALRKSNLVFAFGASSMLTTLRLRDRGETLAYHGLPEGEFALSGGSVPIRVAGAGLIAAVTVSGLPEMEDHALAVQALGALV